jgi:hypothetical protein
MVVQITYQTQLDAANKYTEFTQTEFFESDTLPDKPTVVRKLTEMGVDFAEASVLIAAYIDSDADTIRKEGFRITEI